MKLKEWHGYTIIIIILVCAIIFGFSYAIDSENELRMNQSGIIIDKYILGDNDGNPNYLFVINNESFKVKESNYYNYEIGDYFEKPFIDIWSEFGD